MVATGASDAPVYCNRCWSFSDPRRNGACSVINLGVPITGKRSPKQPMIGDDESELRRGRAIEAYDKQRRKQEQDRTGEKALAKIAEMKTGREVTFAKQGHCPNMNMLYGKAAGTKFC